MAKPMYYWNGTAWEAVAPVVPQSPIAYQASAPSSPSTGDLWIDSDQDLDSYQRQLVRYKFNATGGETSLSGTDANGATLSYTPGAEQVYLNGALLVRGSDYVATNGTSITSLAALSASDVVEIFAYVAFNPANTYTQSQVDGLVAPMGLVHINTTSFSAVSSISVNDVFSATYDNYKIIFTGLSSTLTNLLFRVRVSGSDLSGSNYNYQYVEGNASSTSAGRSSNQISFTIGGIGTTEVQSILEISNVFATKVTGIKSFDMYYSSDTLTLPVNFSQFGNVNNTTSYTGFTIYPSTGTMTGTVKVYGYKE